MKTTLNIHIIFFLLLVSNNSRSEATINVEILNGSEESILYYVPSNGEFTLLSQTTEKTDENGQLKIKLDIIEKGFVYLFPQIKHEKEDWLGIQVYVEPDSYISVHMTKNSPDATLSFEGENKSIQEFLNNRERHFLLYLSNYDKSEKLYVESSSQKSYDNINLLRKREIETLKQIDNIEEVALMLIVSDINCYYTEAFYSLLLRFGDVENEEIWRIKNDWVKTIKENNIIEKLDDYSSASLWYESNLNLKRNYFGQIDRKIHIDKTQYLSDVESGWKVKEMIFSKKELRIHTRSKLYYDMHKNQFDEETLNDYINYKSMFSNSAYFDKLSKPFERQLEFKSASSNKLYLEKESLNSLKDIAERQDVDYILIDLWATWCGPCIKEFSISDSLKQFIRSNPSKVSITYISLDESKPINEIEKVINFHHLDGFHVLSNEILKQELERELGVKGNLSLPTYAIIDSNGNIMNRSASRPSKWNKLKSELLEIMSLKESSR